MSYYYQYFIGYEKNQKIYPYGPYDCNGKLKPVVEKSRSFASNLHDSFFTVINEQISEELRKEFEYEDYLGEKKVDIKYLPFCNLPNGEYIVKGYFLIEDIQAWKQGGDDSLFYNVIDAHTYNELMKKELVFGKNQPEKDDEGFEYTIPNASDYIYDAIPNYNSKEYEAELIRQVGLMLFDEYELSQKYNLVIIESEG